MRILFFFFFMISCAGYQPVKQELNWAEKYGVFEVKIEPTKMLGNFPYISAISTKQLSDLMSSYKGIKIEQGQGEKAASLQLVIKTEDKISQSVQTTSRVQAQIDPLNGETRPSIYIPATSRVAGEFHFTLYSNNKKKVFFNRSFKLSESFVRQNLTGAAQDVNEVQNRALYHDALNRMSKKAIALFKQVILDEF